MSGIFILTIILLYFLVLMAIAHFTSKGAQNDTFFSANKSSKWYLVSFGMIGASLSGITFISVPGMVGNEGFSYMQMVIGYMGGYAVIAFVLLPLYYRLNLTSIYAYLGQRYGAVTHQVGAGFFLLSRILGASVRLFLVADVLDYFVLSQYGVSFEISVMITLLLIYIYTYRGGIKTIVWTDTLQTAFMLLSLLLSVYLIYTYLGSETTTSGLERLGMVDWFVTDTGKGNFWLKGILGGFFITLAMTGLDQDMMQKNLTCKNKQEAQKNMIWFSVVLFAVNFVFLLLGALLFLYMETQPTIELAYEGMAASSRNDRLFPLIALNGDGLGTGIGILFILGLVAAAYSSADSALTSLTTSASVDIFGVDQMKNQQKAERQRKLIHVGMTILLFIVILLANAFKEQNIINTLFKMAGYTYGPLLGLFFFGILSKRQVSDNYAWLICVVVPVLCYVYKVFEPRIFDNYATGHELLGINGLLCLIGLFLISKRTKTAS